MTEWLETHPRGAIIVHCDTGFGRACQFAAAYLLVAQLAPTAADAIQLVAARRTAHLPRTAPLARQPATRRFAGVSHCVLTCALSGTRAFPGPVGRTARAWVAGQAAPAFTGVDHPSQARMLRCLEEALASLSHGVPSASKR